MCLVFIYTVLMCFILACFLDNVFGFHPHILWCLILICFKLVFFIGHVLIVVPVLNSCFESISLNSAFSISVTGSLLHHIF